MRRIFIVLACVVLLTIVSYFAWWQLPVTINRSSDIKLGNEIIKKIEIYSLTKGLPENADWTQLKQFGFIDKYDFLKPEYSKIDKATFELIFTEGFDGPYLIWNSKERKWKKGFPTFPK